MSTLAEAVDGSVTMSQVPPMGKKVLFLNCHASSHCMWGVREAAFPPAATASEREAPMCLAFACVGSANRHVQALPVQMGLAGTIHLFL